MSSTMNADRAPICLPSRRASLWLFECICAFNLTAPEIAAARSIALLFASADDRAEIRMSDIADDMRKAVRSAQRAVGALRDRGVIEVELGADWRAPNVFRLVDIAAVTGRGASA